jgi:hypothetical protein
VAVIGAALVKPALLKKAAGEAKTEPAKRVRFGEVRTVMVDRWIDPSEYIHPTPDVQSLDNLDEDEDEDGEMAKGGCSTPSPSGPRGRDCPRDKLAGIRNNLTDLRSKFRLAGLRRRMASVGFRPLEPARRTKVKLGNVVGLLLESHPRLAKKIMKPRNPS